jgi:ABC-type tungstate transport system permease subunit
MCGVKVLATLMLAATVLTGCDPKNKLSVTTGTGANPVPVVETVSHGYETADGTVVRYSDVETGKDSAKDCGQKGDYSDRATAR